MAHCCLSLDLSRAKAPLHFLAGVGTTRAANSSSFEDAFLQGKTLRQGATEVNISGCNCDCRAASCSPYHGVCVGHLQELRAALGVPKGADPQAVGRVELLHQEVAAHLDDLGELQKACSSQQTLYSVLL